ncbi:MAG TPA: alanine racemase [Woeseiaceae bacterium]|nr:alanine racemase [Woeseiaceae bacterium]
MSVPRSWVRLDALRHNFQKLRETAGEANVVAVVKADAYGHGLLPVARSLPDADAFAVARFADAMTLAEADLGRPIVLFGGVYRREELKRILDRGIQPAVHCRAQLELLESAPRGNAVVWLKVDTGMGRLGFEPGECDEVLQRLRAARAVGEVRLMTHLANADDRSATGTLEQVERFRSLLDGFDGDISVANSAGLLGWTDAVRCGVEARRSWMRCGLALYGASPFARITGRELGLRSVMQFGSALISVKRVRAGDRVGYGGVWQARQDTVIGIIAAGYGDGYSRYLPSGAPVLVNGRRVPLAGRVSMDFSTVDLGPDAEDVAGDPVTLWGDELPVEEVAAAARTIPYTLLCGVTAERRIVP